MIDMADTFRKVYTELTEYQKGAVIEVKERAEAIEIYLDAVHTPKNGREIALAKTKLEEAIMWAVKGITA